MRILLNKNTEKVLYVKNIVKTFDKSTSLPSLKDLCCSRWSLLLVWPRSLSAMFGWLEAAMASPSAPMFIFRAMLVFSWLEFLWRCYLSIRQLHVLGTNTSLPRQLVGLVKTEAFESNRKYSLDKTLLDTGKAIFEHAANMIFVAFDGMKVFWDVSGSVCTGLRLDSDNHVIARSLVFFSIFRLFTIANDLTFDFFFTFVVNKKNGRSRPTLKFFAKDQIKRLSLIHVMLT